MKEWTPRGQALGEAVRKRRRELGMSKEELACRCGLTRTYISLLERGLCGDLLRGCHLICSVPSAAVLSAHLGSRPARPDAAPGLSPTRGGESTPTAALLPSASDGVTMSAQVSAVELRDLPEQSAQVLLERWLAAFLPRDPSELFELVVAAP